MYVQLVRMEDGAKSEGEHILYLYVCFFHLLDFVRFKYFVHLTLCVFALMLVRLTACKFVRVCARDGESERKP